MRKPSPRELRRSLWIANVALATLVVAAASPLLLDGAAAPRPEGPELVAAWERTRHTGLRWSPPMPVSDAERRAVLFKYEDHAPAHWPFVGPLPPEPVTARPSAPGKDTGPDTLEALGRIELVVIGSIHRAISFAFHEPAGRTRPFAPGEIIRARASDPARFRLLGITEPQKLLYHVHYEVLQDDAPVADHVLVYDERPAPIRRIGSRPAAAGPDAAGTPADASARTPSARVVDLAQPAAPVRLEALRPTRHINPRNPRDRVVEFDPATFAWSRGKGVAAFISKAKTKIATDIVTGKTLGIRVTGFEAGVKPERFDVRPGDVLVSVAGQPVASRADIERIAGSLDPARLVPVVIDRRGVRYTYRIDARDPHTKRKIRYFDL